LLFFLVANNLLLEPQSMAKGHFQLFSLKPQSAGLGYDTGLANQLFLAG
jgi:hypothetical protein